MRKRTKILIGKLLCCIIATGCIYGFLKAQPHNELGIPFIKNYNPKTYKGLPQIFGITQDADGIIYFTGSGITEYDGEAWRKIPPLNLITWSIILGNDNRIYIGGTNDLGYLQPNSLGQRQFTSLLSLLPKEKRNFGQLRQIATLNENVYFASLTGYLIEYNTSKKKFQTWKKEGRISILGVAYGELYVEVSGLGLCKLVNNEIIPIAENVEFDNSSLISVLPYEDTQLLICTRDKGLFLYNNSKVSLFETEADKLLKSRTYLAKALPDKTFIFSIIGQGLIVLDKEGKWLHHLTKNKGLVNNIVLSTHINTSGEIWLGTNSGLSKVDLLSPLSKFSLDENSTPLFIDELTRFKGNLFGASTNTNGLLHLDKKGQVFRRIKNHPPGQAFSIKNFKNQLYGMGDGGIFQINNFKAKPIYHENDSRFYVLAAHQSKLDSNRIFLAPRNSLLSIYEKNNRWLFENKYEELPNNLVIRHFIEIKKGQLWVGTQTQGIWLIEYKNSNSPNPNQSIITNIQSFKKGLDSLDLGLSFVYSINNKITFTGAGGIFTYDENEKKLISDIRFPLPIPSASIQRVLLAESNEGVIYTYFLQFNGSALLGAYRQQLDKTYIFETEPFQKIPKETLLNVSTLYSDASGILWIASRDGLIRFDTQKKESPHISPVKIRQVYIDSDSLIFLGHGTPQKLVLPYAQNNIHFHYLATNINISGKNQYQTQLIGFDKQWSDWTVKTDKAYTNLPEGDYAFQVQGKTPSGKMGQEVIYSFTILPPWWRTWWAYLSYVLICVLSLYSFSQWRNRQLLQKSKRLELIIQERTAQIEQLFQEAKKAKIAAEEANEAKSTFLSTVSHELRTPLTSVIGFAKIIKKRLDERILPFVKSEEKKTHRAINQVTQNLNVVISEGERLTTLINDVLDLAKIEAGRLDWNMENIQINPIIQQAVAATSSLFEQKSLPLKLDIEKNIPTINGDKDRLIQVLINLISNAIKFTDEGSIFIRAFQQDEAIIVTVKDAGIGISKEDIPKVFEKFKQVGNTLTDKPKGTGLGLPICKEIIEYHKGKIWAESELGQGSTFLFQIPINKNQVATFSKKNEPSSLHESKEKMNGSPTNNPFKEKTILIVDDEPDIRNLLRQEITEKGYHVREAINGKEAIKNIRKQQPDLIILDVMMPEMNGFDVAAIIKNDPTTQHIPIIVISITDDKQRITRLGIDRYLTKPIDMELLLKDIATLLE